MKRLLISLNICAFIILACGISYAFYETLPSDLGSNSSIMEIISPADKETVSYDENYLVSCTAEPGTEITLYERYDDTLFIPMLSGGEAITGIVGESGLLLTSLNLPLKKNNRIMFFAQKGTKYQTIFKTIFTDEKEIRETIKYKVLDIRELAVPVNKY